MPPRHAPSDGAGACAARPRARPQAAHPRRARSDRRNAPLQVARPLAYRRGKMTPKTFKIKSFGCQMNVYDGERMAEMLSAQGMNAAAENGEADLIVLNTC